MYHETILAGVLISLLYTEFTGLSAGLIVPGYLALCLHSPWRIVDTLVIAAVAVGICKLLSKSMILYGRRRFAFLLVLTFFLSLLAQEISLFPSGGIVIGTLIPGIIAREFDRQGFADTLLSLALTTGLVAAILLVLGGSLAGL